MALLMLPLERVSNAREELLSPEYAHAGLMPKQALKEETGVSKSAALAFVYSLHIFFKKIL